MTNVGIMTMHRIVNYGSFLQAYALKHMVESLGAAARLVDFRPGYLIDDAWHRKNALFMFLRENYHKFNKRPPSTLERLFGEYLEDLGVGPAKNYRTKCDLLIVGSDEVFNCLQDNPDVGFATQLYGRGIRARRLISYAGSCGQTTYDGLCAHRVQDRLAAYLTRFAALSVRDANSQDVIGRLTGIRPEIHADPALIFDFSPHLRRPQPLADTLVVYSYPGRFKNPAEIQAIQEFARARGKTLITVGNRQPWVETHFEAHPLEMLGYLAQADFIVTDTFHGTIFSLNLNKNFAAFLRPTNVNKLSDLLNRFRQNERLVPSPDRLSGVLSRPPDYAETNGLILQERARTRAYLQTHLSAL